MRFFDDEVDRVLQPFDIEWIPIFDFDAQEKLSYLTIMKIWHLESTRPIGTLNFNTVKQFLVARYKIFEIEAPHKSLIGSKPTLGAVFDSGQSVPLHMKE